jgi:hypothetical protein
MPENDVEMRSRERREEEQRQQELLNSIRDNNSIFTEGQMQEKPVEVAKDWMAENPGDAFLNLVKLAVEHHTALSKLIRFNNSNTKKINDINDNLIKIDDRTGHFVDELKGFKSAQKDMKKMSVWTEQYSKQTSKKFDQHVNRLDQQETLIRNLQQEKRDLENDQGSMMKDIIKLQNQYRTLVAKGSIKKSKKKRKKTRRRRS